MKARETSLVFEFFKCHFDRLLRIIQLCNCRFFGMKKEFFYEKGPKFFESKSFHQEWIL